MITTISIIVLVVALSILAVAVFIFIKGQNSLEEAEERKRDLDTIYNGLMKKQRELDLWDKQLHTSTVDFMSSQKIWANFVVEADQEPDDRAIYKSLASKLGYGTMKFFSDRIRITDKADGRKVYSIEVNVIPYGKS
jgi:hypothetical protein